MNRPTRPSEAARHAEKLSRPTKSRLVLSVPAEIHRRIKVRAAELDVDMADYVVELVNRDLAQSREDRAR
jgi:hypothetical protein